MKRQTKDERQQTIKISRWRFTIIRHLNIINFKMYSTTWIASFVLVPLSFNEYLISDISLRVSIFFTSLLWEGHKAWNETAMSAQIKRHRSSSNIDFSIKLCIHLNDIYQVYHCLSCTGIIVRPPAAGYVTVITWSITIRRNVGPLQSLSRPGATCLKYKFSR